jgi:hypothetical protein
LWATARRGTSSVAGGGGIIGGGSELAVVYEATGGGAQNSGTDSLTWTHTSSGGPNCAVVLIGAVDYTDGTPSISANYGRNSFVFTLGQHTGVFYDRVGGNSIRIFALGIITPPSGTQAIVLSATGATINKLAGNTLSYQNVGSFGNFYDNVGVGNALSLSSIPSATNEMVVGGFASVAQVLGSFNQTPRWNQNVTASVPMVIGDAAGAGTVSFTAATATNGVWVAVGGVLLPSS